MLNTLNVLGILHMNRNVFMLLVVGSVMTMSMQTKTGYFLSDTSVGTSNKALNYCSIGFQGGWFTSGGEKDDSGYVKDGLPKIMAMQISKEQKEKELAEKSNQTLDESSPSSSITE